jgi:hypothetical protein
MPQSMAAGRKPRLAASMDEYVVLGAFGALRLMRERGNPGCMVI